MTRPSSSRVALLVWPPLLLLLGAILTARAQSVREQVRAPLRPARGSGSTRLRVPDLPREFRGVWVATVANIDWPSSRTLSTDQQKAELVRLLDQAKELNLNAIILQVRPQCDALYASALEPWSEYLTGQMGRAPEPYYDPLEFAASQAHARGLELHAWFNPYRALHPSARRPPSPDHISQRRPDLAKPYGTQVWLDPGEKEVQEYCLSVVLDVVRRYDIDGVHFDDYFYPYVEKDASGRNIPFPDDASWQQYLASGGTLSRADWRRQNVNDFIQQVYRQIKGLKPAVKFGISPFGIWKSGNPTGVVGLSAYDEIYADSRKWLAEGWVDYLSPQLYWPITPPAQSYTALLDWWLGQNLMRRHLWPGNAVYKISNAAGSTFPASELLDQVNATRQRPGATGNVHFSMVHFLNNRGGITDLLRSGPYAQPALIPASPWIDNLPPEAPGLTYTAGAKPGETVISWTPQGTEPAFWWVVYVKRGETWESAILPGAATSFTIPGAKAGEAAASTLAVSAVDRAGNESQRTVVHLSP